MRNRMSGIFGGLAFILVGIGFAGNAFNLWDYSLFFNGWWTLFIIVPCFLSLFQNGLHTSSIIGLAIGVLLLLSAQGIVDRNMIWKLMVPVVFVLIGIRIMFRGTMQRRFEPSEKPPMSQGGEYCECIAIFSGREERITGRFEGANITTMFGGVELDLRDAVIDHDVAINATAVFGGVDIFLPPNVRVKINSTPVFGGIENKTREPAMDMVVPVVYVDAFCAFGGLDIK
ncbi:LiaF domain-containing protein [Oscillospiraceae bacterium PP1C4]